MRYFGATVWFKVDLRWLAGHCVVNRSDMLPGFLCNKVGRKAALCHSAAYPYDFGKALAELMPTLGQRPDEHTVDFTGCRSLDASGALDDLIKGRKVAWWYRL